MQRSGAQEIVVKLILSVINLTTVSLFIRHFNSINIALFLSAVVLLCFLFILLIVFPCEKCAIYKILSTISVVVFVIVILLTLSNKYGILERIGSVDGLKNIILSSGKLGVIVFFLLTVLQVVILPIPAGVTVIMGSLIYGPTVSFIVSALGTIAGSMLCYLIGRFFGYKVVAWIAGKEKTEKLVKMLGDRAKLPFVLMLLFPFFPDDILCMVVGMSKMSIKFFVIVICIVRPISLSFISYFGTGNLIPFKGWGIPVWITLFVVTLLVCYLISYMLKRKKFAKKQETNLK